MWEILEKARRMGHSLYTLPNTSTPGNYFIIGSRHCAKVLDASASKVGVVHIWDYHGGDNQKWFFDGKYIHNKRYPGKVLDFHWMDYRSNGGWGKVYLLEPNGGFNQQWAFNGINFECLGDQNSRINNLMLDIHGGNRANGAKVGVYQSNYATNQQWVIYHV